MPAHDFIHDTSADPLGLNQNLAEGTFQSRDYLVQFREMKTGYSFVVSKGMTVVFSHYLEKDEHSMTGAIKLYQDISTSVADFATDNRWTQLGFDEGMIIDTLRTALKGVVEKMEP